MFRAGGHSTALNVGTRRKVNTTFEDGSELVEEYDLKTHELLLRKRRQKSAIGKESAWEYLFGDEPQSWSSQMGILTESSTNPLLSRKDTKDKFQWRIRNLPYPQEVYNVGIQHSERKIIVKTSNKKYYKKISIPEMELLKQDLSESKLSWTHANNTLIVSYDKPVQVLQSEVKEKQEVQALQTQDGSNMDCKQQ